MKGTEVPTLGAAVHVVVLVAMHILFCSCLCTVCSKVSDSHAFGILSCSLLAMHIVCSCLCKVCSQFSDAIHRPRATLSLAFLADFTALICFIVVWIKRHDHSVHMSSVLQVQQFYTAGIPLLEAYLLPMANNRTRNERLSQEQNGR